MLDPFTLHQGKDVFWEVTVLFQKQMGEAQKLIADFIFNFYFISFYMPLHGDVFYMHSTFLYNPHCNCIPNIYATANKYKINHNFKN